MPRIRPAGDVLELLISFCVESDYEGEWVNDEVNDTVPSYGEGYLTCSTTIIYTAQ